jgi:tripartite-type tricarboxylate transporter receptor subunit TctC
MFKLSSVMGRLSTEAFETQDMSPAEFTKFVQAEIKKWGPVAAAVATEKK